jgi:predicted ATPase
MVMEKKSSGSGRGPRISFRWQNFRSFKDTGCVDVRPITVFIGANSTGKTSLFLPLLLLKQTLASKDRKIALKTTGPIVDLGNYREMVFGHHTSDVMTFSIRFPHSEHEPSRKEAVNPQKAEPGSVSFEFSCGRQPHEIKLKRLLVKDTHGKTLIERKLLASGGYSLHCPSGLNKKFAGAFRAAAPRHFIFSSPFEQIFKNLGSRKSKKVEFKFSITREEGKPPSVNPSLDYLLVMSRIESEIESLLNSVSYLGPLREYPQRFYEASDEVPESVGSRGEKTPEILQLRKDSEFRHSLTEWLRKFELAKNIQCESLGRGVFAVRVTGKATAAEFDYADTGFGLSQLLPLIVQGLHGERGSILCVEQPEIHLNPKLQSMLANFFAAVARDRKFVIVETHSEHFLLRLRTLIAEKVLRPDQVALYYVEKIGDHSEARRIIVGEDGHIEPDNWPAGFFEDSMSESLHLATLQKS